MRGHKDFAKNFKVLELEASLCTLVNNNQYN